MVEKVQKFMTKTTVYCKVQFEGIHNWPGCPFEEVKYLRVPHRHIFHIKAWKQVYHDDRDCEFIMLKHRVQEFIASKWPDGQLGAMSCEMIGQILIEEFELCAVDVSEDDENGAYIEVSAE